MTPRIASLCAGLLGLLAGLGAQAGTEARLDGLFAEYGPDSPGCSAAVLSAGKVVYSKAYGSANLEHRVANTPATRFYAASTAKPFTAAAIAKLALDQKLNLADSIRQYVPELPAYADRITLEQLVRHTDGLRDYFTLLYFQGRGYDDALSDAEILALVTGQRALNFEPGSEFLYANSGYWLLAKVVAAASGMSLRDYAQQHLFAPLGMNDTEFVPDFQALIPRRAEGYVASGAQWLSPRSRFAQLGPSGLVTTSEDLLKWMQGLHSGALGTELAKLIASNGTLSGGAATDYGFGLFLQDYRGVSLLQHGGARPGYHSNMVYAPELGIGIALLCNFSSIDAIAKTNQMLEIIAAHAIEPRMEITLAESDLEPLVGSYEMPDSRLLRISKEGPQLYAQADGQGTYPIYPIAATQFFYKVADIAISFQVGQGETIESLTLLQNGSVTLARRSNSEFAPLSKASRFDGQYVSAELGAVYEIRTIEETVYLGLKHLEPIPLQRTAKDQYALPGATITLARNAQGAIDGFWVGAQRVRQVRFRAR